MPHIHLRTSADLVENVDIPEILEALVQTLCAQATINSIDVKAYHTMHPHWTMGQEAPTGFAHVTVSLMTGREQELLKAIGDKMYETMKQQFCRSLEMGEIRPTLEIRQMPKETYWKPDSGK